MMDREMMRSEMRARLDRDWFAEYGLRRGLRVESELARDEGEMTSFFEIESWQIKKGLQTIHGWVQKAKEEGVDVIEYRDLLQGYKEESRIRLRQMEELERQLKDNWQWVDVESERVGRHRVPVVKFDLHPELDTEGRVPYVLVPGIAGRAEQIINLAAALAMVGKHKVYVMTYPEQVMAECPKDWQRRLSEDKSFGLHAELFSLVTQGLGLEEVSLVGFSNGGGIVLQMAIEDEGKKIHDLIVLDPMGFEERSLVRMGWNFFVQQGLVSGMRTLNRGRLFWGQRKKKRGEVRRGMFNADADILRRKQFDEDKLAEIRPKGKFQVWIGSNSPLTDENKIVQMLLGAEVARSFRQRLENGLKIFKVKNVDHSFPMVHSLGLVRMMEETGGSSSEVIAVDDKDLEDYVAWWVFTNILGREYVMLND